MERIAKDYGLNLDDAWNKDLLPHQGRHPNEYHDMVTEAMRQAGTIAQGDTRIFIRYI